MLIPDTTAALFVTLVWVKPFQLEQYCLITVVHALSSFKAEDAIFDFSLGTWCNNHVVAISMQHRWSQFIFQRLLEVDSRSLSLSTSWAPSLVFSVPFYINFYQWCGWQEYCVNDTHLEGYGEGKKLQIYVCFDPRSDRDFYFVPREVQHNFWRVPGID